MNPFYYKNTTKNFNISKEIIHNVILIGESGTGKSTLINAIANYLTYNNFDNAIKSEPITLVGTSFYYMDNSGFKTVKAIDDENECTDKIGDSATQLPKSYKISLGRNTSIRLIDTPGINDTRGTEQDKENFEATLKIIGACREVTAICIVMKSDHSRINRAFIDCLKHLVCQLDQSFVKNMVFIFTSGKGVNYKPINAYAFISKIFNDLGVEIKIDNENINCFENDAFNYLLALKRDINYDVTNPDISWKISAETTKKLMKYILSLEPHNVQNTININKTRNLIEKLTIELTKITEIIGFCLLTTYNSRKEAEKSDDYVHLKSIDKNPFFVCETIKFDKPRLVCMSNNCTRFDSNGNTIFPKTCCPDCGTLKHMKGHGNYVIFAPRMWLGRRFCSICDCLEKSHKMILFETRLRIASELENIKPVVQKNNKEALKSSIISNLEDRYKIYSNERNVIIKAMAIYYYYLKFNSIIQYEDAFEIQNQDKLTKIDANSKEAEGIKNVIKLYTKEKILLQANQCKITNDDLDNTRQNLCALQFNGKNIKKIFNELDSYLESNDIHDERRVVVRFFD